MNPLGNGFNGLTPDIINNIQQIKGLMRMNPNTLLQQNPMLSQLLKSGQNPQQVFMSLCQQRGIDPNAILNELRK